MKEEHITDYPSPFSQEIFEKTSREEKIAAIEGHIKGILEIFGCNLSDPSLAKTPQRVAKMYVDELFAGFDEKNFPKISLFPTPLSSPQQSMVVTKVRFFSFCEHHLVPMIGEAFVGYIPHETIIGLSKISRLVRHFAARPQLQERLTAQIVSSLSKLLHTRDVIVTVTAFHTCVMARGAKDESASTTTTVANGLFEKEPSLKAEFLSTILLPQSFQEKKERFFNSSI